MTAVSQPGMRTAAEQHAVQCTAKARRGFHAIDAGRLGHAAVHPNGRSATV